MLSKLRANHDLTCSDIRSIENEITQWLKSHYPTDDHIAAGNGMLRFLLNNPQDSLTSAYASLTHNGFTSPWRCEPAVTPSGRRVPRHFSFAKD